MRHLQEKNTVLVALDIANGRAKCSTWTHCCIHSKMHKIICFFYSIMEKRKKNMQISPAMFWSSELAHSKFIGSKIKLQDISGRDEESKKSLPRHWNISPQSLSTYAGFQGGLGSVILTSYLWFDPLTAVDWVLEPVCDTFPTRELVIF